MDICLSKTEWKEVLVGLQQVPHNLRGDPWIKAGQIIYGIIEGKNTLADKIEVNVEGLCFDVVCSLCKQYIKVGQDYAYRGMQGAYNHLDCWYQQTPDVDDEEEEEDEPNESYS